MHSTSKHALLRLVVSMSVVAVVAVAWAGSALASGAAPGTLELCKSSLNGMSGRTFSYTVTPSGGSAIGVTVKGGRCSGPIQIPGGNATILEQASDPATDVAAVRVTPSARLVSQDLAARKAVVSVPVGSTVANETRVTFVNQPAGGNFGDLKICKLTETPAFIGKQFSFKVNGGSAISVEAGDAFADPASWSCRLAGHFQVGSKVTVQELIPNEAQIAWIDTDPVGALTDDYSTADGHAVVTIGSGMTIVMYDNEPFVPQGNGYIEVCKDRALLDYHEYDWAVQGSYHFTITDQLGAVYERDVLVGQCSEPIEVAAGIATVEEAAVSGIDLVDVWTLPEDRLQTTNLINRTATVEIPVSSDANDETQVHFVNKAQRAQLKICKALGPNSSDLVGQAFYFNVAVDSYMKTLPREFRIVAGSTTQCKIWGDVTIGTDVEVTEDLDHSVGAEGEFIDTTGEGTITIRPGINTITITNTAMGQLEICKAPIRGERKEAAGLAPVATLQPEFSFKVDGTKTVKVRAGKCSFPLRVSVGNHVVQELDLKDANGNSNYELDPGDYWNDTNGGIKVYPADREVARNLNTKTVTVSVPYGPKGETLVTFYNRVKRARLKICKLVPMTSYDSLYPKTWQFNVSIQGDGSYGPTDPIHPGECTYVSRDFPIIDSAGNPTKVSVTELAPAPLVLGVDYKVDSITVQFARYVFPPNPNHPDLVEFNPGPGVNVVTYTNKSIDP